MTSSVEGWVGWQWSYDDEYRLASDVAGDFELCGRLVVDAMDDGDCVVAVVAAVVMLASVLVS